MNKKQYHQELRKKWEEKIKQWRQSGKSGAEWCRENNQKVDIFYYWSNKLSSENKEKPKVSISRFIEIPEDISSSGYSGIDIKQENITLRIDKDFDETCLCRILKTLQKM